MKFLAFSPDGRILATSGSSQNVQLWDTTTGQEVRSIKVSEEIECCWGLAFSPDGRTLAVALHDGVSIGTEHSIKLLDPATGQERMTLRGYPSRVFNPTFSPDGRRIAASHLYGTLSIGDLGTGRTVLNLLGGTFSARSPLFTPDGRKLVAVSDEIVKVWDATPMTPEQRVIREARGLVAFLSAKSPPKDEFLRESAEIPPSAKR